MTQFDPPQYVFTAATSAEALRALEAARELIDSHLMAAAPDAGGEMSRARLTEPMTLHLELDLAPLVRAINEAATLRALDPEAGR
jgi:pentose-5-phosphate-3-epimerase